MTKPLIIGLGEVLWDVFPDGARFGGAPANFACTSAVLAGDSAEAAVASAVGDDDRGRDAIEAMRSRGVRTEWVQRRSERTGQVSIQLDAQGQASYEFAEDTAWDNLAWTDDWSSLAARANAVCFGTLAQRSEPSRETIHAFLDATGEDTLRVFDINLRPPFWTEEVVRSSLTRANVLKCNEDELPVIARLADVDGGHEEILRQLQARFGYRLIALTLGAEGSVLLGDQGDLSRMQAEPAAVVDTVGAGDSLTAAMILGLLRKMPLPKIHDWATRVAAYVCSQAGATPGGLPEP